MSVRLIEPYQLKPKLLAWSELNVNEVDLLLTSFRSSSIYDIYNFLEKFFDLSTTRPRERIILDLYYYAIKFAIENNFTKIQISSFISILRAIHRANQECPFDNQAYLVKYFKELIICHSIKRPPYCIDVFDNQNVVKVVNYITNTYLRHFHLYKYAFTPKVGFDLKLNYVDRAPSPDIDESFNDESNNNQEKYEVQNQNAADNNENSKKRQLQLDNLRDYVKNVLVEHLNSDKMKDFVDDLRNDYQTRNIKSASSKKDSTKKK